MKWQKNTHIPWHLRHGKKIFSYWWHAMKYWTRETKLVEHIWFNAAMLIVIKNISYLVSVTNSVNARARGFAMAQSVRFYSETHVTRGGGGGGGGGANLRSRRPFPYSFQQRIYRNLLMQNFDILSDIMTSSMRSFSQLSMRSFSQYTNCTSAFKVFW